MQIGPRVWEGWGCETSPIPLTLPLASNTVYCATTHTRDYASSSSSSPPSIHPFIYRIHHFYIFWATVCKTVRPMLSDRCLSVSLSVCPVCNVGVLWPSGWMDQNETWHADRPRPWPHCVRWERGTAPNFRPISVVTKWLDGLSCHLVWR